MPGRKRRPRPPGIVNVFCTWRGGHEHHYLGPLQAAWTAAGDVTFTWGRQWDQPPVTTYRHPDGRAAWWRDEDGRYTFEFKCPYPRCPVHVKLNEVTLTRRIRSRAQSQQGDGRDPIWFDISAVEREDYAP